MGIYRRLDVRDISFWIHLCKAFLDVAHFIYGSFLFSLKGPLNVPADGQNTVPTENDTQ